MNRKLTLLLIVLIGICAISHASAADNLTDAEALSADVHDESFSLDITDLDYQISENASNTHYVNPSDNVQSAIDSAKDGDTIYLSGTFELNNALNINKTLNIVGYAGGAVIKPDDFNFKDIRFFNIGSAASNVVLKNLVFTDGNNGFGGAIHWQGNGGSIVNCQFNNNIAKSGHGGAVVLEGNGCRIENCIFNKNRASQDDGGAIWIGGDDCQINNCTFDDNHASQNGGAMVLNGENIKLRDCNFTDNYANKLGGAIFVKGMRNTVSNSTFDGNYVLNPDDLTSIANGGAIFSGGENLAIDGSSFTNNRANTYGGAVYLDDYNVVRKSYFLDNHALVGKDIYANPSSDVNLCNFTRLYNESESVVVYGLVKNPSDNNSFTTLKVDSSVVFSASMIFKYGASGSILVTVDGGTIEAKNIRVLNHSEAKIAFKSNTITVSGLKVGKYILRVTTTPDENHISVDSDLNITVEKATAAIRASKMTVALKSGAVWKVTIVDSRNKKPIEGMNVTLQIFTGKKYRTVNMTTNSKGEVSYKTGDLSKGKHKVVVSANHEGYEFNTLKSSISVIKPKELTFKLQAKVVDNDGSLLSYTVLDKKTGKGINNVEFIVKIYTGKKYKTYSLVSKKVKGSKKTYNGALGFSTNKFTAGNHKVVIMPASIKYKGSTKTTLKIKKSATKGPKYFRRI